MFSMELLNDQTLNPLMRSKYNNHGSVATIATSLMVGSLTIQLIKVA